MEEQDNPGETFYLCKICLDKVFVGPVTLKNHELLCGKSIGTEKTDESLPISEELEITMPEAQESEILNLFLKNFKYLYYFKLYESNSKDTFMNEPK